jgi:hypothetical protein
MGPKLAVVVEGARQGTVVAAGTTIRINHQHLGHVCSPLLVRGSNPFSLKIPAFPTKPPPSLKNVKPAENQMLPLLFPAYAGIQ